MNEYAQYERHPKSAWVSAHVVTASCPGCGKRCWFLVDWLDGGYWKQHVTRGRLARAGVGRRPRRAPRCPQGDVTGVVPLRKKGIAPAILPSCEIVRLSAAQVKALHKGYAKGVRRDHTARHGPFDADRLAFFTAWDD